MKPFTKKSLLFLLMISSFSLSSCGNENSSGLVGRTFDISKDNDSSVVATFQRIKKGYKVIVAGTSEMKDFTNTSRAPWYALGNKLAEVEIEEGVSSIGGNAFNFLNLKQIYLPKTVTKINKDAFKQSTKIYSYASEIISESNLEIYYYSESKPTDLTKQYWHIINGSPVAWEFKNFKTLFIGNSFTFYSDVPLLTQNIATDLGYKFVSESVTKGSHRLSEFANENDEEGAKVYKKLKESNDYDFVILQEQSVGPLTQYNKFLEGAKTLSDLVKNTQTSAKVRLYETWGYEEYATSNKKTIKEMEGELKEKYNSCAKQIGAKVHYVGSAFTKVYEENKDINLYHSDNKHPSLEGAYLSALVHVGSMFEVDVRATTYKPTGIDETTAIILRNAAYQTVFNN